MLPTGHLWKKGTGQAAKGLGVAAGAGCAELCWGARLLQQGGRCAAGAGGLAPAAHAHELAAACAAGECCAWQQELSCASCTVAEVLLAGAAAGSAVMSPAEGCRAGQRDPCCAHYAAAADCVARALHALAPTAVCAAEACCRQQKGLCRCCSTVAGGALAAGTAARRLVAACAAEDCCLLRRITPAHLLLLLMAVLWITAPVSVRLHW